MDNNYDIVVNPTMVNRPPFAGRYFMYAGKRYLFTHRHPYKQEYWSDDVPVSSGRHTTHGAWIPTDKLTPV